MNANNLSIVQVRAEAYGAMAGTPSFTEKVIRGLRWVRKEWTDSPVLGRELHGRNHLFRGRERMLRYGEGRLPNGELWFCVRGMMLCLRGIMPRYVGRRLLLRYCGGLL